MTAQMKKLRVLLLNHNLRNDGTFFRAFPLAEQLVRRGHRTTLLTVSRERRLTTKWSQLNGVDLGETPNLRPEFGATGYGLLDNLARVGIGLGQKWDLIHLFDHKPNATVAGFLARHFKGVPVVSDWADWWGGCAGSLNDVPHRFPFIHRLEDWWEIRSKLWSDGVSTISQVLRQRALEIGVAQERLAYIPTGAPLEKIRPGSRNDARARLRLEPDCFLLGFVGISQNDLEILFSTLACLPQVRLLLIGPVFESVKEQARNYGVLDRVLFPGRIHLPELNDYLASTDVLCMPMTDNAYNRGRLPNKLLDYLAAGRPVVANPVGDVATILESGTAGVLADGKGFPKAVQELLENPERASALGRGARLLAESQFDWNRLVVQVEELYQATLDYRKPRGQ